ncbi:MAG: hypothetical protein WA895_29960 [Streptosporangiaceae bacterium]
MLAERLAALIIGHEPGWRLPRPTALARRFNVTVLQIECAIRELVRRRLVRQLPDGSMYRASPADYHIALEGIPGIGAAIDPMGASITCTSRHVSWRRIPEDIALILGLLPAVETSVIRCHWAANGYRAALSTTYLASRADLADSSSPKDTEPLDAVFSLASPAILATAPDASPVVGTGPVAHPGPVPAAVHIEMQAPPLSAARSLDLAPGEPAISITVRFHAPAPPWPPVALTVALLRADLFRIVLDTPQLPGPAGKEPGGIATLARRIPEWDQ